jgi:hypothetical protein
MNFIENIKFYTYESYLMRPLAESKRVVVAKFLTHPESNWWVPWEKTKRIVADSLYSLHPSIFLFDVLFASYIYSIHRGRTHVITRIHMSMKLSWSWETFNFKHASVSDQYPWTWTTYDWENTNIYVYREKRENQRNAQLRIKTMTKQERNEKKKNDTVHASERRRKSNQRIMQWE